MLYLLILVSDSFKNVKENDFVYLDPPYATKESKQEEIDLQQSMLENNNTKKTKSKKSKAFVNYVADGFNIEKHILLFNEIKRHKNIKFVMSNAKVDLVMDNFKEYNCQEIQARRAINAKKPGSTATEVIIHN